MQYFFTFTQTKKAKKSESEKDDIIRAQAAQIRKLKKQNQLLKNKNDGIMSAKTLPKTVQKRAATEILMSTDKFSPAEVGQMFKPKKTITHFLTSIPHAGLPLASTELKDK